MGKQNDTTIPIRYATCECIRFRSFTKDILFAASGGELTPKEIRWVLERWNRNIDEGFADGQWNQDLNISSDKDDTIAHLLRYVLGHPDKRIRWRGVHSLRRIANRGEIKVLSTLLKEQNSQSCVPFQDKKLKFYWISSKLHLWICLARISEENPAALTPHLSAIKTELSNKDSTHILIVHFVKYTLNQLIIYDKTLFTEAEIEEINVLLKSPFKRTEDKSKAGNPGKYSSKNELRFDFDQLDTIPYWYASLGRCFNVSGSDVAFLAEKHIVEKWGYTGNPYEDDHIEVPDREYGLTSNRHGSIPTVENLKTYFEYHAMFCAAGDLLQNEPILENDYHSWDDWLRSNVLSWDKYWLSDLLDPLPREKKFWVQEQIPDEKKWGEIVDDEYYDSSIGLDSGTQKSVRLLTFGRYSRYLGDRNEVIDICSALVSKKNSDSLLRALQTATNNHDYRIPLEGDSLEISEEEYILEGWLKQIESEYEGLDIHDQFGSDVCRNYITFGKEVNDLFEIEYDPKHKEAYLNEEVISTFTCWSNAKDRSYYDRFESAGNMFYVNIDFLLNFLEKCNRDMIIECTITRQRNKDDYDYKSLRYKNNSKLYILKSNGEITTIRGTNYKIR